MLITQELLPILELSGMNTLHDEEIELIARLHTAGKNNESETVFALLDELIEHTGRHFAEEERMMIESEYPNYHLHRHEHARQLLDLQAIRSFLEMTHDARSIAYYLEGTLTPWIIEHVENFDSTVSAFLTRKY